MRWLEKSSRISWLLICGLLVFAGLPGCNHDEKQDATEAAQVGPDGVGLSDDPYQGPPIRVMLTDQAVIARVTPIDSSVWGIRIDAFRVLDHIGRLFVTVTTATQESTMPEDENAIPGPSVEASRNISTAGVTDLETWVRIEKDGEGGEYHRISRNPEG